jgi:hypothetical protein
MARGWESKSVESQKEDGQSSRKKLRRRVLTADEMELQKKRESLEMSRRRIAQELAATTSELRKTSLKLALSHLDEELDRLKR